MLKKSSLRSEKQNWHFLMLHLATFLLLSYYVINLPQNLHYYHKSC